MPAMPIVVSGSTIIATIRDGMRQWARTRSRKDDREAGQGSSCGKVVSSYIPASPTKTKGDAEAGVGSTISRHVRRGGTKLYKEHGRYCTVAITDEFRRSKVCPFCFRHAWLAHIWRMIDGVLKPRSICGAVECSAKNIITEQRNLK
ncbi:hypothetical protein EDD21DRAFT_357783 [Dissophora ornata]|nr:hypothetical protein EDD21DRAFT_357783 [Dissophora ornata]